jgi:hypothetical protein
MHLRRTSDSSANSHFLPRFEFTPGDNNLETHRRHFVGAAGFAIVATTLGALLARGEELHWRDSWQQRYVFVARHALLLVAITALAARIALIRLAVGVGLWIALQLPTHHYWRTGPGDQGTRAFVAYLSLNQRTRVR